MTTRNVIVRPGHRFGWWVEGRKANGKLFMKTWWPSEALARTVARWVGGQDDGGAAPSEHLMDGCSWATVSHAPGRLSHCGPCSADP